VVKGKRGATAANGEGRKRKRKEKTQSNLILSSPRGLRKKRQRGEGREGDREGGGGKRGEKYTNRMLHPESNSTSVP